MELFIYGMLNAIVGTGMCIGAVWLAITLAGSIHILIYKEVYSLVEHHEAWFKVLVYTPLVVLLYLGGKALVMKGVAFLWFF